MIIESDDIIEDQKHKIEFLKKKQKKFVITQNDLFFNQINKKIANDGEEIKPAEYEKEEITINGVKYSRFSQIREIDLDKVDDKNNISMPFSNKLEDNINERDYKMTVNVDTFTENMIYFTFNVQNFIKKEGVKLILNIINPNKLNFLQLDGEADSFINKLVLFANDEFIESIENYSDISYMKQILFEKPKIKLESIYLDNKKQMILASRDKIDSYVFCPPIKYDNFKSNFELSDGKFSIQEFTKWRVEIPLKLKSFLSKYNCISEQVLSKKITIGIELNRNAMFVPVYNSTLSDISNATISNTKSFYYYALQEIYDFLSNIRWSKNDIINKIREPYKIILNTQNFDFALKSIKYTNKFVIDDNNNENISLINIKDLSDIIKQYFDDVYETNSQWDFEFSSNSENIGDIIQFNFGLDPTTLVFNNKYYYELGNNKYRIDVIQLYDKFPSVYLVLVNNGKDFKYRLIVQKIYKNDIFKNINFDDIFVDNNNNNQISPNDKIIIDEIKDEIKKINIIDVSKFGIAINNGAKPGWLNKLKAIISKWTDVIKVIYKYNDNDMFLIQQDKMIEIYKMLKKKIQNNIGLEIFLINGFLNYEYLCKCNKDEIFTSGISETDKDLYKNIGKQLVGRNSAIQDLANLMQDKNIDIYISSEVNSLIYALNIHNEIYYEESVFKKAKESNKFEWFGMTELMLVLIYKIFGKDGIYRNIKFPYDFKYDDLDKVLEFNVDYSNNEESIKKLCDYGLKIITVIKDYKLFNDETLVLIKSFLEYISNGINENLNDIFDKVIYYFENQNVIQKFFDKIQSIFKNFFDNINQHNIDDIKNRFTAILIIIFYTPTEIYDLNGNKVYEFNENELKDTFKPVKVIDVDFMDKIQMSIINGKYNNLNETIKDVMNTYYSSLINSINKHFYEWIPNSAMDISIKEKLKKFFKSVIFSSNSKNEILTCQMLISRLYYITYKLCKTKNMTNQLYAEIYYLVNDFLYKPQYYILEKEPENKDKYDYKILQQLRGRIESELRNKKTDKSMKQSEFASISEFESKVQDPFYGISRDYKIIDMSMELELHSNNFVPSIENLPIKPELKIIHDSHYDFTEQSIIFIENDNSSIFMTFKDMGMIQEAPTYREKTLLSIPFDNPTLIINDNIAYVIESKVGDTWLNYKCLKELADSLGYSDPYSLMENTNFNRFNYALQYPSNYFISLKMMGKKAHMIKYNKGFTEVDLDILFDTKTETQSMFVFGISLQKIKSELAIDKIKTIRISSKNLLSLKDEYSNRYIKLVTYSTY